QRESSRGTCRKESARTSSLSSDVLFSLPSRWCNGQHRALLRRWSRFKSGSGCSLRVLASPPHLRASAPHLPLAARRPSVVISRRAFHLRGGSHMIQTVLP